MLLTPPRSPRGAQESKSCLLPDLYPGHRTDPAEQNGQQPKNFLSPAAFPRMSLPDCSVQSVLSPVTVPVTFSATLTASPVPLQ
jgi:hypothetical protein